MAECIAKSKRSKKQCKNWVVRGRSTCRIHGGKAKGPRTEKGKELLRLAVFKHGMCSQKAKAERREATVLIRCSKELLESLG